MVCCNGKLIFDNISLGLTKTRLEPPRVRRKNFGMKTPIYIFNTPETFRNRI